MLPLYLQAKRLMNTACCLLLMMVTSIYASSAFAQTQPAQTQGTQQQTVTVVSAGEIVQNIATQLPFLMQLATAFAYVAGMYFVLMGLLKLKHFGESRTQLSQEHHLREPLMFLIAGALLLYLPSSVQIGLSTFWSTPAPYGYLQQADQWSEFLKDVFLVVQLFGVIAFIRGLIILSHMSGHAQHGTFGKAITHIIGGLFCINIYQLVQVVMITLGIQT